MRFIYKTILLFFFLNEILSCKHLSKLPNTHISLHSDIADSSLNNLSIFNNLFSYGQSFPITIKGLELNIPTPPSGLRLIVSAMKGDTSIVIPNPDTIRFSLKKDSLRIAYQNEDNLINNLLSQELRNITFRYLTKNGLTGSIYKKEISEIDLLLKKYNASAILKERILNNIHIQQSLTPSKFTMIADRQVDSSMVLKRQYSEYISKIDKLKKEDFYYGYLGASIENLYLMLSEKYSPDAIRDSKSLYGRYQVVRKFFKRKSMSYQYLISYLQYKAGYQNVSLKDNQLKKFRRDISKSAFKENAKAMLAINKINTEYIASVVNNPQDKTLYDENLLTVDLDSVLLKYKGSPLLIDFWASWCTPCIKKLPVVKAYKNQFPQLNIIFISLDKDSFNWKSEIENRGINGFKNYKQNTSKKDSLFKRIETIPKYGLLTKEGELKLLNEMNKTVLSDYIKQLSGL